MATRGLDMCIYELLIPNEILIFINKTKMSSYPPGVVPPYTIFNENNYTLNSSLGTQGQQGFQGIGTASSIPGPQGYQGRVGAQGVQGIVGAQGTSLEINYNSAVNLAGTTEAVFTGISQYKQIGIVYYGVVGTTTSQLLFVQFGDVNNNYYGTTGAISFNANGFAFGNIGTAVSTNNSFTIQFTNPNTNVWVPAAPNVWLEAPTTIDRVRIYTTSNPPTTNLSFAAGTVNIYGLR